MISKTNLQSIDEHPHCNDEFGNEVAILRKFIQLSSPGVPRDDEGRVRFPTEYFYGNELIFSKEYGHICNGVLEDNDTLAVLEKIRKQHKKEEEEGTTGYDIGPFGVSYDVHHNGDSMTSNGLIYSNESNYYSMKNVANAKKGALPIMNHPMTEAETLKSSSSTMYTFTKASNNNKTSSSKPEPSNLQNLDGEIVLDNFGSIPS